MKDEKKYISKYDPRVYDAPIVSIDTVVFTIHENTLKVLLVKRKNLPYRKKWALVGGFVDMEKDANLEQWAKRLVVNKTTVKPPILEQFTTVGSRKRDKRYWSVSVCYFALMAHEECKIVEKYIEDVQWVAVEHALDQKLAFDHNEILEKGIICLREKAVNSIIPAYMLPEKFKISEIQKVHEVILNKSFPRASFYRRLEASGLLVETGEKSTGRGRSADLYKLKPETAEYFFARSLIY